MDSTEQTRPPRKRGIDYAPICEILRRKGLKWQEITEWFEVRGIVFDKTHLRKETIRWGHSDAYAQWCETYDPTTQDQILDEVTSRDL